MDEIRNIVWEEYGSTVLSPIAVLFLFIMLILIISLKRRDLAIPLILTACLIPFMQRIVVAGIDFTLVRILIIFSWIRIILKNENKDLKFHKIDKVIIIYVIINLTANTLLWQSSDALINRLGFALDTLGAYFLFRISIIDFKVIKTIIKTLAFVSIIIALFMLIEQINGRNLFSIFGGVPEITPIREGKLRSQGAFSHSILAGTFGALLLPLMWGIFNKKAGQKIIPIIGVIVGITITLTSSSSTPMMAVGASLMAITLWTFRNRAYRIYVLILAGMLVIQLMMDHPIWFLIQRIDLVGGSTGYHRYLLIDQAVKRINSWWLFGIKTTAYWGWGLQDITNQYVLEGTEGGLMTLLLFIYVIALSFKRLKYFVNFLENRKDQGYNQRIVWSLGVTLFSHVVVFIGVSYFGQMMMFYYLLIALIASLNDNFFNGHNDISLQ
jgi:hypothetical protein